MLKCLNCFKFDFNRNVFIDTIFNIFDTKKLLNRPMHVSINATSGLAGIAYWINDYFELEGENKLDKSHPVIAKIKEMIDKEYANGRCSVMGDDELVNMLRTCDKSLYKKIGV